MTAKQKAEEIFMSHYVILMDSDSDKGEEVIVSVLSKKLAIKTVEYIIEAVNQFGYSNTMYDRMEDGKIAISSDVLPDVFWENVKKELEVT